MQVNQQLTRGQEVMSVQFNPGQREDVAAIKQVFANTYDEIDKWLANKEVPGATHEETMRKNGDVNRLTAIAKTNLETAQMYAVKAVTR